MKQQSTQRVKRGVFGRFRRAWSTSGATTAVLYVRNDPDSEAGNDVSVALETSRGRLELLLTTFTSSELEAFHRLFEIAFETARDIVEERDLAAERALDDGITEYARCFRPEGRLIVREGSQFSDTMNRLPRAWTGGNGERLEDIVQSLRTYLESDNEDHAYRGGSE